MILHRRRLFDRFGLRFVAAVSALAVLVGPVMAAQDDNTVQPDSPAEGAMTMKFPKWPPMRLTKYLYQDNAACPTAKLDMWLQEGAYMYSLFLMGTEHSERADHRTDDNGTTLMIGGEGCRYRVRIERAN